MSNHLRIIIVILFAVVCAVGYNYYRIIVKQNYQLIIHIPCDPKTERCFINSFVSQSDPLYYFKAIEKRAYNVQGCDEKGKPCDQFFCQPDEKDCKIFQCGEFDNETVYDCEKEGIENEN